MGHGILQDTFHHLESRTGGSTLAFRWGFRVAHFILVPDRCSPTPHPPTCLCTGPGPCRLWHPRAATIQTSCGDSVEIRCHMLDASLALSPLLPATRHHWDLGRGSEWLQLGFAAASCPSVLGRPCN